MRKMLIAIFAVSVLLVPAASARSPQSSAPAATAPAAHQTETDEYTRYELLAPDTASFKIHYEVTATTAGATFFYNPIRKGSAASDEVRLRRHDRRAAAFRSRQRRRRRKDPLMADADASPQTTSRFLLARPSPAGWPGPHHHSSRPIRTRKSYYREGDDHCFQSPPRHQTQQSCSACGLRIRRLQRPVANSHRARRPHRHQLYECKRRRSAPHSSAPNSARRPALPPARIRQRKPAVGKRLSRGKRARRLSERAHQDRDIVYFLQQPETHAVQPLPRLHRIASRRQQISQCRPRRQHRLESLRLYSRYWRKALQATLSPVPILPPRKSTPRRARQRQRRKSC